MQQSTIHMHPRSLLCKPFCKPILRQLWPENCKCVFSHHFCARILGYSDDIWRTVDGGSSWGLVPAGIHWSPRSDFGCCGGSTAPEPKPKGWAPVFVSGYVGNVWSTEIRGCQRFNKKQGRWRCVNFGRKLIVEFLLDLPSRKLTKIPWKSMVRRWFISFFQWSLFWADIRSFSGDLCISLEAQGPELHPDLLGMAWDSFTFADQIIQSLNSLSILVL